MTEMKTYIFKTQLLEEKKIVREIEIGETATLYQLAEAIIDAFEFTFDHAFGFFDKINTGWRLQESKKQYELFADREDEGIELTGAKSVKKTKISRVWKGIGDKMLFLFDYGDDWRWIVTLKGFGKKEAETKYPRVLKSVGDAPEQYPDYA